MATLLVASPLGWLRLSATDVALTGLEFVGEDTPEGDPVTEGSPTALLLEAQRQLGAYFADHRVCFDLPFAPEGSPFQKQVWSALSALPAGAPVSYGELSGTLGLDAGASRAIGRACGTNPIPLLIPCHRVIGGDGGLRGYVGELWRKRWLLAHESGQSALF